MGRAGRGSSGTSSHSSSSSHSFSSPSRSGSSHRMGSSSLGSSSGRASRGMSSGSFGGFTPSAPPRRSPPSPPRYSSPPPPRYSPPPSPPRYSSPPPPRYYHIHPRRSYVPPVTVMIADHKSSTAKLVIAAIVMVFLLLLFGSISSCSRDSVVNTTNREKLDLGYGYPYSTLTDELGWVANPGKLNKNLKEFYDKTGAVPYVALVSRPEITTEGSDAEFDYANQWYTDNLSHEGYVLFMYFDSGSDTVDGNGQLIVGKQASVLMDAEAQNIFWSYMDYYWTQDISEDEMFALAFSKTADRIMQKSTTSNDVLISIIILVVAVVIAVAVIVIVNEKFKREKERAEETERILNTPLDASASDPLLSKYSDKDKE